MREIKFRAFHRGRMEILREFNEHHIYFDDDGMQTIQGDMHLMQFTGLKDKNGVEIYEGDILQICNGSINGCHWMMDNRFIKFNEGSFNVPLFCIGEEQNNTHWCVVIGNIHDNPELLK